MSIEATFVFYMLFIIYGTSGYAIFKILKNNWRKREDYAVLGLSAFLIVFIAFCQYVIIEGAN
jgi:hypothetical protein